MGFLMFLSRKIQLQNKESDISYQLTALNSKLEDYTKYASILQQDSISLSDIADMPSSLFSQGLTQLTAMNQQAAQIAGNQMAQAQSSGIFGTNDQNMQIIAQQKMYENARAQLQKKLAAQLNEEEKSMTAKKTRLETELTEVQQEEQACTQQIANGVKNQISTFGLNG
jgi:hypothetical protein